MTIEIGTRVGHKHYSWMVGTVTLDATPTQVYVAWDCDRFWAANDSLEFIDELRPTPHQPAKPAPADDDEPRAIECHGDLGPLATWDDPVVEAAWQDVLAYHPANIIPPARARQIAYRERYGLPTIEEVDANRAAAGYDPIDWDNEPYPDDD